MDKKIVYTLDTDEIKEAIALWVNCHCSKQTDEVTKDGVILYSDTTPVIVTRAEVSVDGPDSN